jgi:hypothetical protein
LSASPICPNSADGPHADIGASCIDPDPDDDLYLAARDNCPGAANPDQADRDADGLGDACDQDDNSLPDR